MFVHVIAYYKENKDDSRMFQRMFHHLPWHILFYTLWRTIMKIKKKKNFVALSFDKPHSFNVLLFGIPGNVIVVST